MPETTRLTADFINELGKHFTGELRADAASRVLYSTDASIYQIEPLGVAFPHNEDDLQAAVEVAGKYHIPVLPRGSGSSLGGQAIGEALILDCSRFLDRILEINSEDHSATVEPGVILSDLNRAAGQLGLMFGPDPASAERATMGGVIGNNATGAHSILYGMSADHLVRGDVILADGTRETWDSHCNSRLVRVVEHIRANYVELIRDNFPLSWRNSAGYRLNYLFPWAPSIPAQWDPGNYGQKISVYQPGSGFNLAALLGGSEGTLAVIRRLKVNLVPKPTHTILGLLTYPSVVSACEDIPRLLEFKPSAIELIPQMIIRLAREVPAYAHQMGWMSGDPQAVLVVEFSGSQRSRIKEKIQQIGDLWVIAETPEEQARVWNVRKMGLGILDSRPTSARPAAFIEDCAIPINHLGEFVREVERILEAHGTQGGIYGHASAGCLHIRPILDLKAGEGVRSLRSIGEQVLGLTLSLGGSMSSEHGDGIVAGEWIEKTYGKEVTRAMRLLKQAADPDNLLNPNKMFDAPPMDSHLRYGEGYAPAGWIPSLRFDHERGFMGAVEQCNGQGVCRKKSGVMCPSFQATRDEMYSTRGRANLLRALINSSASGRSTPANPYLQEATFSALDLCLACKGCSSECPSGVDMPKLKYEFFNQYYRSHRRPVRDYLFGYFHVLAHWLQPVAPIANAILGNRLFHWMIARLLGISIERPFPKFSQGRPAARNSSNTEKKVIFLSDVFSRFLEPEIEQAALEVLQMMGFQVRVLSIVGAGASLLSKGFIDSARQHAEKVLNEIRILDDGSDICVVGCEPPEIYCLKHEYFGLLPERQDEIESLAKRVWLVEEFVLRQETNNELRIGNKLSQQLKNLSPTPKITLHPHCHQRAEGLAMDGMPSGSDASVQLLRLMGYEVEVMDAGCCGMAGTFGYDAAHYPLSMRVGELGVLPKARNAEYIVTTGSACRIQIRQGAGREAPHPILLVRDRMQDKLKTL